MRTLIIPCAGKRQVDGIPLYLQTYPDSELVAIKAIAGIYPYSYDRIIYTILREHDKSFQASYRLQEAASGRYKIEIVILDEQTYGPAETVYQTIEKAGVVGEFAVRDSHAYLELKKCYEGNFVAGLDLTKYEDNIENLRSKSFLTINEQGQILDIIEKHFYSDIISAGMYGFKKSDDFILAYKHLCDPNYSIKKLYLSHIISYLIGYNQRVFHRARVTKFEDWSTHAAWHKIQKKYALCFIDIDSMEIDNEKIKYLQHISEVGITFVGFTIKNDSEEIFEKLISEKVNVIAIINNCPKSKIRTIISNYEELYEMVLESR